MGRKTGLRCIVLGLCLTFSATFLTACGQADQASTDPSEVFILGVSSLDWSRLDALMDKGELPHFRKIVKEGARADPQGEDPLLMASLWTSIQTGKKYAGHRVFGNFETMPDGLVCPTRTVSRFTTNVWQMLSRNDHSVAIVGLPVTFPAETVQGQVISNVAFPNRWTETSEVTYRPKPGLRETFPNALYDEVKGLYHGADTIKREELTRFFVLNESEFAMAYDQPLGSIIKLQNPMRDFALTHQVDLSYLDMALYLKKKYQPDVTACLLELPAVVSRVYWYFTEPEGAIAENPNYRRFRNTVDETYRWVDEQLGRVLDALDENGTLIVMSERGFGIDHIQEGGDRVTPVAQAQPRGVLILYGHGVAKDKRLQFTKIFDFAPTLLAMERTPIGEDLDGTPLMGAFTDEFAASHRPLYRDSYDKEAKGKTRFEEIGTTMSQ